MQDRGLTQLDELEEWANFFGERRPTAALTPRLRRPLLATYAALASRLIAIACTLVDFFTVIHLLIQLPGVEGTYHILSSATAYRLQGAGVITPLAYLLTISLTSSVRGAGTKHGTAPLAHHQDCLLVALPVVDQRDAGSRPPRRPSPPPSSPSSKPGSGSALFKSTLYTLSAAATIAHWVFLQTRPPSPLPPEHPAA